MAVLWSGGSHWIQSVKTDFVVQPASGLRTVQRMTRTIRVSGCRVDGSSILADTAVSVALAVIALTFLTLQ